jgi:hypothetical protein
MVTLALTGVGGWNYFRNNAYEGKTAKVLADDLSLVRAFKTGSHYITVSLFTGINQVRVTSTV